MPEAPDQSDKRQELVARLQQAVDLMLANELDHAASLYRSIQAEARAGGWPEIEARVLTRLAVIADLRGAYVLSERYLRDSLAICARHGNHAEAAACHFGMARGLSLVGKLDAAEAELGLALMEAKLAGSTIQEANAYALHGECRLRRGLLQDAFDYYSSACSLYRDKGQLDSLLQVLLAVSNCAVELGSDAASAEAFEEALALDQLASYASRMTEGYARLARIEVAVGNLAGAEQALERCAGYARAKLDYDTELELELARGVYLTASGKTGEALERFARAKRISQKMHNRFRLAEIRLEHAKALIAYGRLEHAQAVLLDTELAFELFGARNYLARCLCCWTSYFAATNNTPAALASLERAKSISAALAADAGRSLSHAIVAAEAELETA